MPSENDVINVHALILALKGLKADNISMKDFLFFELDDYKEGGWVGYITAGIGRFIMSFPNPLGRAMLRAEAEADERMARHEAEMKAFTEASRIRYLEAVLSDEHGPPHTRH